MISAKIPPCARNGWRFEFRCRSNSGFSRPWPVKRQACLKGRAAFWRSAGYRTPEPAARHRIAAIRQQRRARRKQRRVAFGKTFQRKRMELRARSGRDPATRKIARRDVADQSGSCGVIECRKCRGDDRRDPAEENHAERGKADHDPGETHGAGNAGCHAGPFGGNHRHADLGGFAIQQAGAKSGQPACPPASSDNRAGLPRARRRPSPALTSPRPAVSSVRPVSRCESCEVTMRGTINSGSAIGSIAARPRAATARARAENRSA